MSIPVSALQPCAALFVDLPVTIGQVALSQETAADIAFLRQLYRSTREEELALTGWPEAAKQAFCDSQFDLQRTHYLRQHPAGEFLVVRRNSEAVGRLYLDAGREIVHLIDIALLPAWRGHGIGSTLLKAMQGRAAATDRAMSLQVLVWNRRAIALYRRFGFAAGHTDGLHLVMHWRQTPSSADTEMGPS